MSRLLITMNYRRLVSACVVASMVAISGVSVAGQASDVARAAPAKQAKTSPASVWKTPRMPWGNPDLQGIWTKVHFGRHVLLERPPHRFAMRCEADE